MYAIRSYYEKAGLKVAAMGEAVKGADVVMMLLPDEHIAAVYQDDVEPRITSYNVCYTKLLRIFIIYWNLLVVAKARVAQDRLDFWIGVWAVHGVMIPILVFLFVQRANPFLLRLRRRAP